jgi:hypothetical protein
MGRYISKEVGDANRLAVETCEASFSSERMEFETEVFVPLPGRPFRARDDDTEVEGARGGSTWCVS